MRTVMLWYDLSAMILGSKLRGVRRSKGKTIQQVALSAGLSVGFVSQVERGIAVPSIASLKKLALALEQPVGNFLEVSPQSSQLTRSAERLPFALGHNALTYERLSHSFDGSKLSALLIHEPPGHRGEPVSHEGEELFFMIKGELTVEVEEERVILRAGDSYHFDSTKTHCTWNHRTEVATLLWCGTMDVFGTGEIVSPHQKPEKLSKNGQVSPLSHIRISTALQEEQT